MNIDMYFSPLKLSGKLPVAAAVVLFGAAGAMQSVSAADVTLPAEAALPTTSTLGSAGFTVRTILAPGDSLLANSYLRALKQLDGSLLDSSGTPYANIALPGGNLDGGYDFDVINFSLTPDGDYGMFPSPDYPDFLFPGLFEESPTKNFTTEVVTFLNLPAGTYTFGITAQNDRTDVNDDDGWKLYTGLNARSFFATPVAEFQHSTPPFTVNKQGNTNEFNVTVPVSGIYPFRLTYWQSEHGAQLEWYVVLDPESEFPTRVLLNDPSAAYAYRSVAVPAANGPYISSISPQPDSSGVAPTTAVEAVLADGEQPIDLASVKLYLNNTAVTPQTLVRDGRYVRLKYSPNAARSNPENKIRVEFKDTAGLAVTNSWNFGISVSGAPRTVVRGQWDFDNRDLSATTGKALRYFDRENDGFTASLTQFGTTTEFGISDIDGVPAQVIRVPGDLDNRIGYVMEHGISPNGGGTKVNQYTLIFDIYVDPAGPTAASLIQISDVNNPDREDGDLFWQGSNFGQGTDGYKGTGAFTAGGWHRVCAAYDLGANPPVVTKFVDGIKQDDWTAGQQLDAARRALQPTAVLFADGDHDERRVMYVNSIQIRPGKLSDAQLALLGGPKASGIPLVIPTSTVAGQWDFDNKDLRATVGKDLEYFDIDTGGGLTGLTKNLTQFGTTTEFGIDGVNGEEAMVMRVPGDLDNHIGYVMTHRIAPNGGGSKVNQYTITFDLYVETSGPTAASLIQISDVNNGEREDGDLFWQGSNFGQGTAGYNGTGAFTAGSWHRVSAAYNLAANPPVVTKYVDGIFQDDWTTGQELDAPRRALQPTAILFADGDHDERRVMYVNSIQIRAGALSKQELAALGGPTASGIPLALPPRLTASSVGGGAAVSLSWPAFGGNYVLESATDITAPNWQPVAGVANNAVTIPASGAGAFFRLRKL